MRLLLSLLLLTSFCTCGRAPENAEATEQPTVTQPVYEDLSPAEFAEKIGAENTVLLDVRTPAEIAGGKISGAVELDYRAPDFAQRVRELDPAKTYLVYCASGGRSGRSCEMLKELGVKKAYNLKGGYSAWKE